MHASKNFAVSIPVKGFVTVLISILSDDGYYPLPVSIRQLAEMIACPDFPPRPMNDWSERRPDIPPKIVH